MISAGDLVCLPYTPDLTEAGIAYACRSLPHTYDRMGGSPFERMRRIVGGIAVELAFRRYLTQQGVPFDVKGATPFTDPDRYDVSLGGHRCDIKSSMLIHRDKIKALHRDPALLLQAPGLVPVDQYSGEGRAAEDLYLFAFLTGLVAVSPADADRVARAGQPAYLAHAMPEEWVAPRVWAPLGPLVLKSESPRPLTVDVGGQGASREFITRQVVLEPGRRTVLDGDYYSVAYLHVSEPPEARLGIRSPVGMRTHIVQPAEWGNIWVYGMRVFLAGWIAHGEFRQKSSLLPAGSSVFQYDRTRTKNLALPVADLHPLGDLLVRVRTWTASRSNAAG